MRFHSNPQVYHYYNFNNTYVPHHQSGPGENAGNKEVKSIEIQVSPERLAEGGQKDVSHEIEVEGKKRRGRRKRHEEVSKNEEEKNQPVKSEGSNNSFDWMRAGAQYPYMPYPPHFYPPYGLNPHE